jgi:ABC-type multidrug transport system fused ATPase/permease subunit
MGFLGCSFLTMREVALGRKPIGNFVTFTIYWGLMISPLQTIAWSYQNLTSTLIDAERLLQLLQTSPSVKEREDCSELRVGQGKVEFRNVSFAYTPQKDAVKRLNFEVLQGTTIALVGESGAGKSTLFGLLLRSFDPTEGSIVIDGQELSSVSLSSLREAIGVVPQDPGLFNTSILQNIQYANQKASNEEVEDACKAAAIHEKIMSLPSKYNTVIGERGVQLSGGQRQRIAIARVLVKKPRIVLLDEATSAVDSLTEEKVQEAFKNLGAGRTMFVIAHRLSTTINADQILVMHNGEIIESGRHEELLAKKGKYFELWDSQTKSIAP